MTQSFCPTCIGLGSEKSRVKYGTASWVYGEELSQRTAMWWSPDGKKLAFYRFDESKVPDFYLATNLTKVQDTLDVEAYPKPGVPNPVVESQRSRIILTGDVPSPANPPPGCAFSERCWLREKLGNPENCTTQSPPLSDAGGGHLAACHWVDQIPVTASPVDLGEIGRLARA